MSHFRGKTVLVTGAGGSIASELCLQLLDLGVSRLKCLSLTESGLYNVARRLKSKPSSAEIVPILGSVTNPRLLSEVCRETDMVIHAAAHKHVPICEENPSEAILNNVFGTKALIDACIECQVGQFVLVSTDKAVNPASVMGATKRIAELLVHKAKLATNSTQWITVRFGNVLNSAGSVLPLWREQIENGGPITITDERCERYFMSIPNACELVLEASRIASDSHDGLFVFDMGEPVKIKDLATRLILDSGLPCDLLVTGLRPGEKLREELHVGGELAKTSHPKIFRVEESFDPTKLLAIDDLHSLASLRKDEEAKRVLYSAC